jgi:hypothetical protein
MKLSIHLSVPSSIQTKQFIFLKGEKLGNKNQKNTLTIRNFFKTLKHETKKGNTVK